MFLHSIKILMTPQMDKSLKVRQNAIPRTATAVKLLAVKKAEISFMMGHTRKKTHCGFSSVVFADRYSVFSCWPKLLEDGTRNWKHFQKNSIFPGKNWRTEKVSIFISAWILALYSTILAFFLISIHSLIDRLSIDPPFLYFTHGLEFSLLSLIELY